MKIKLANRKDKVSYVDCVGYAFSLKNNILFLTGDSKIEKKKGVEFLKNKCQILSYVTTHSRS